MKKIIRLTEADLTKMIQRVVNEQEDDTSMDDTSMDEHINWDIKTIDCEGSRFGNMSSMGVDKDDDGNIFAFIRYCKGDDEELEYLKRKARRQIKMENQLPSDDETMSENKNMKKIVRLTESDLTRIVRGVIIEGDVTAHKNIIKKLERSVRLKDWDLVINSIKDLENLKDHVKGEINTTDDVNSMVMGLVNSHYR